MSKFYVVIITIVVTIFTMYILLTMLPINRIDTQWLEDPPTISTDCWSFCKKREPVSWSEYVERYHASKMKLDQPK